MFDLECSGGDLGLRSLPFQSQLAESLVVLLFHSFLDTLPECLHLSVLSLPRLKDPSLHIPASMGLIEVLILTNKIIRKRQCNSRS